MDLAKANPRAIATRIVSGRLQLEEVPSKRRNQVAAQVEIIKQEKAEVAKKKVKPKAKPEAKKDDSKK